MAGPFVEMAREKGGACSPHTLNSATDPRDGPRIPRIFSAMHRKVWALQIFIEIGRSCSLTAGGSAFYVKNVIEFFATPDQDDALPPQLHGDRSIDYLGRPRPSSDRIRMSASGSPISGAKKIVRDGFEM
jgi:hypothetical protein